MAIPPLSPLNKELTNKESPDSRSRQDNLLYPGLYCTYNLPMITFDETKRQANIAKHGVDMAELSGFFDGALLTREDTRYAYTEQRFQSVGWHEGILLFVVWTPGEDEWPHIISARKAVKHEREAWARCDG